VTLPKNLCIVKTADLTFDEVIGEVTKQVIARGTIDLLAHKKPPARQIIDTVASVKIKRTRVVDGKVIFDGEVEVKVIYEAAREDQPVFVADIVIPFSDFVDIEDATADAKIVVKARIEDVEAVLTGKEVNGFKKIQVTVVVEVLVKVVKERVLKVAVDVSGPKGIEVRKEILNVQSTLAVATKQINVRETENLDDLLKPPFVQLIDTFATVDIEDFRVIRDKVIFQGMVHVKVLYATKTQQVVVLAEDIPFRDFIDVPGAEPGADVDLDVEVEHITVTAEDRDDDNRKETITKTVILKVTARVLEKKTIRVVTDVTGVPGIEVTKQLVRVEEVIGEQTAQVIVREVLDPEPQNKPCIIQVIDCRAFAKITNVEPLVDKVVVEGEVEIKVIYESEAQAAHVLSGVFSFSTFVDIPGVTPDLEPSASVSVVDVTCQLQNGPRSPVDVQAVLVVDVRVAVSRQIRVVLAVFCPPKPVDFICLAVVTANRVNVRSGPGTQFPVIGQVNLGDKVTILQEVGAWRKVQVPGLGGVVGFIFGRFVRCIEPLG
jgi:hypothetical protein